MHATVGSAASALGWLCNPASGASTHYLIDKAGTIYQLVDPQYRAWHAGRSEWRGQYDINSISIGIELENANDGRDPYPLAQLNALTALCRQLLDTYHLTPNDITTHAAIALPKGRKSDPVGFDMAALVRALAAPTYSENSPILAAPCVSGIAYRAVTPLYTAIEVDAITYAYWRQSVAVGIDPLISVAQMLHETGRLTSWWSNRPRRNPAGLGVTGETSTNAPVVVDAWALDKDKALWRKGMSFSSWVVDAIPAHLGRLLGYALHPNAMSKVQRALFERATVRRPLPQKVWGSAPTIKQLGKVHNLSGSGWADPGDNYGNAIAKIANSLKGGDA